MLDLYRSHMVYLTFVEVDNPAKSSYVYSFIEKGGIICDKA